MEKDKRNLQNTQKKLQKAVQERKIQIIVFVLMAHFEAKTISLYHLRGDNLNKTVEDISIIFRHPLPDYSLLCYLGCLAFTICIYWCVVNSNPHRGKKFRPGEEYGDSRWGNEGDIEPFIDHDFYHNMIFSKTEMLSMNGRMPDMELNRNKNVLVIGSSGSGKTYGYVKPNILQMDCSYVVTDPKGTIINESGAAFAKGPPQKDKEGKVLRDSHGKILYEPYKIKVLNTIDFSKSMHYNPFVYIRQEKDILKLANALFTALKKKDAGAAGDPFWDEAAFLWLQAHIGLIWYEALPEEQNMNTLIELLNASEVREDDDEFENAVDLLFKDLEREKGSEHFAVRQYKKYKMAAGKTAKSILITLGSKLSPFDIQQVRDMMADDEMELDKLGDEKTILFIIVSDTDRTFNFIASLLYKQMFDTLCYHADNDCGGKLKYHVRCIMDEFANLGKIEDWEILISTIRSREISADMILQSKAQLKSVYKDDAETIEDNCDTTIFLGEKGKTTLKDLEEALGKETIDLFTHSDSRGQSSTFGVNYNKVGKELMSVFKLNVMPRKKCIVQLSGCPPFYSDKYDLKEHPRFKMTGDYDERLMFDARKYLKQWRSRNRLIFKQKDINRIYDDCGNYSNVT
ncbi:MAG: type IV secretory system conjugative DNA transfer family protein [Clostridiales bacterium]|nr:type IV secretory system conjugative DNA transfer family protein [Clostridiales bacterium]